MMTDDNPFSTPAPAAAPGSAHGLELAGRDWRWLGLMLDGAIAFGAALFGIVIGATIAQMAGLSFEAVGDELPAGTGVVVIVFWIFTVPVGLVNWVLVAMRGQSIAKIFLKMRIVKVDGSPCGFVHGVLLRSWVFTALQLVAQVMTCGLLGWLVPLVDALLIFRDDRRTLHDHIAQTIVIKV